METIALGKSELESSRLVYGCMRITGDGSEDARKKGKQAVIAAYEAGYTHFDHADIYGGGKCEELFAEILREETGFRDKITITSKCGVRPGHYNLSGPYILESVDGILSRLGIDILDVLLLHRPDYLLDAQDVAAAFQALQDLGKVRCFGVSNFSPSQVSLLQSACSMRLVMNQVEINIHSVSALSDGMLDQCQELGITPQAWCPLGGVVYPAWGNTFSPEDEARIKAEFEVQSEKYGTENWIIMLAWLLKHPSKILPIIGSTTPERIKASTQALDIKYSREDWYRLLEARNGSPAP